MRRKNTESKPLNTAFSQLLRENGWLLKTTPLLPFLDDEYVYVEKSDRLVHLHISAAKITWEAKRYVREPFGDYTTVYKPLGSGIGLDSLKAFVENRTIPHKSSS